MYKILVVDDEDIVRRSIVQKIEWHEIGFDTPFQACDGHEAYQLAMKVKPDLVFADIKMPIMDGLELANKLKEDLPDTHVVIFSGHDEFKYAQESITLGVMDYILKPLGSVTLTKKFKEIVAQLDEASKKKNYLIKMKDQLRKSLPLLKESFLNGLVCTPNRTIYSPKRMESLDIHLGEGPYVIGIVEPEFDPNELEMMDVFLFGIKNIVQETLGDQHPHFSDANGRMVILFCYEKDYVSDFDRSIISDTLEVLQKAFMLHLNLSTTIGLGKRVDSIDDLYASYNEALSAIDCKYTIGSGKIYDYLDLTDIKSEFYYPIEDTRLFLAAVKSNNKIEIHETNKALSHHIASKSNLSLSNLKFIYIDIVTGLTRLLAESKESSDVLWTNSLDMFRTIENFKSIEVVSEKLEEAALSVASSLSALSLSSQKSLVLKASEFINKHYADDDISLSTVAKHVAVSSGYLSAIFKSEININFNAYLTKVRMEEAKRLLATTDLNVYDIAYETGHSNPHYFSISFKKYTKQSPSDYRQIIRKQ